MKRTYITIVVAIAAILSLAPTSRAGKSEYEYKLATPDLLFHEDPEKVLAKVKKWAEEHRPRLFRIAFSEEGHEGERALAHRAMVTDYYYNMEAEDGWDIYMTVNSQIFLRRVREGEQAAAGQLPAKIATKPE
ncbi:MAG: hypothetical protein KDD60_03880 [Bdellovibrionales bacterium]|nr:hypothetical protein [Bdellovibrionales bacterium]